MPTSCGMMGVGLLYHLAEEGWGDASILIELHGKDIELGDQCPKGSQLRPHIVWFGEDVPLMPEAERIVHQADVLLVVGTSLVVYPAASLAFLAPKTADKYLINPEIPAEARRYDFHFIEQTAATAVPELATKLRSRQ